MAKVLLLGSNGWIGKQLIPMITYRDDVKILYHSDVRVDDIEKLSQEIDSLQPTHIISTIGRTHGVIDGKIIPTIDYLEYPGKLGENIRDNLFSPMILAKLCDQKFILHI